MRASTNDMYLPRVESAPAYSNSESLATPRATSTKVSRHDMLLPGLETAPGYGTSTAVSRDSGLTSGDFAYSHSGRHVEGTMGYINGADARGVRAQQPMQAMSDVDGVTFPPEGADNQMVSELVCMCSICEFMNVS
jgi:hypothetical protein